MESSPSLVRVALSSLAGFLAAFSVASGAAATPRQLPFSYPNETLAEGELEAELHTDVNPQRVLADGDNPAAGNLWEPAYKLQTEIEYGLTRRFELGFYQVFTGEPKAGGGHEFGFDGLKWRVRTRLAEPGELPVDVGFYFELETMHDELAFEAKLNLQRRLGRFKLMTNLWAEEQIARPLDTGAQGRKAAFIVNPTAGAVYEVSPRFAPGVEYWARGQLAPSGDTEQERNNTAVHHFVGPTVHLNFGKLWWSAGVYFHLNDMDTPRPGDSYGPVWVRSVLGMEL